MKTKLQIALLVLSALSVASPARPAILTFDDLPVIIENDDLSSWDRLEEFNHGSHVYGSVTWDPGWFVANDTFIPHTEPSDMWGDGTVPFAHPHSGHWALFNGGGASGLALKTTSYLTGLWLSSPPESCRHIVCSATSVTVTALSGTIILASVSIALSDTTPVFMDTSSFLLLRGVTGYRFDAIGPFGYNGGFFVADDFQFASASLGELCPCEGPWRNHGEYIRCVRAVLLGLCDEGALDRGQARHLLHEALKSDCGQKRLRGKR